MVLRVVLDLHGHCVLAHGASPMKQSPQYPQKLASGSGRAALQEPYSPSHLVHITPPHPPFSQLFLPTRMLGSRSPIFQVKKKRFRGLKCI